MGKRLKDFSAISGGRFMDKGNQWSDEVWDELRKHGDLPGKVPTNTDAADPIKVATIIFYQLQTENTPSIPQVGW
jgi:hypothetical protein